MEMRQKVKERISEIDRERERLVALLDIYGEPTKTDISKSDQYKHLIRELVKQPRSWHITDMEEEFKRRDVDFNKGIIHQVLNALREAGEVIAIKINGSNQRYFYLDAGARNGGGNVRDQYLPIPKEYIEQIEVM